MRRIVAEASHLVLPWRWCPYCNLTLRAYQRLLPAYATADCPGASGATLASHAPPCHLQRSVSRRFADVTLRLSKSQRGAPVFETFVTTKEKGLVMGLAISRSIIGAHGGKFVAGSCHRRSRIDIRLPVERASDAFARPV